MINKSEFDRLQNLLDENPRLSGKKLLAYIEENLLKQSSKRTSIKDDLKNSVQEIFPDGRPTTVQPTRQREIEGGFKVRTHSESQRSDETLRRTPKFITE